MLADRSLAWLGSEPEKRRYFKDRLDDHLRDNEYPRLVFGTTPNVLETGTETSRVAVEK